MKKLVTFVLLFAVASVWAAPNNSDTAGRPQAKKSANPKIQAVASGTLTATSGLKGVKSPVVKPTVRTATMRTGSALTQKHPQPATGRARQLHKTKAVVLHQPVKLSDPKATYVLCNQDFETDWTGWAAVNGNGDAYQWGVGTTPDMGTYTPPAYGTQYACYSDDDAGSGVVNTNEEWVSPAFAIPVTVPAISQLNFQYGWGFQIWQVGENMHALVHVCNAGVWGNWDTLITYIGSGSGTETFDLSAYLPADSIQVKWLYEDSVASSHWGYASAVDNVIIAGIVPENDDVRPQALAVPDPAGWLTPFTLITPAAVVANIGANPATSVDITLLIDSAGVNLYSNTQNIASIDPADTAWVYFTDWTSGPAGNIYDFTVFTEYAQDADSTNDTLYEHLTTFEEVTTINSPFTSTVPTCDGVIDVATEWSDAVKIDISDVYNMSTLGMYPPGSYFLYVKNDANNIYFAVDGVADATSATGWDQIGLYFDDNNNDAWEASPDTTEGNINVGDQGGAGIYSRWIVAGPIGGAWNPRTGLFPVGYGTASGHEQYEAAVPIGSATDPAQVNTMPGMSVGFFALAIDDDAGTEGGWWPQASTLFYDPPQYGTLTLGTSGLDDAALMAIRAPSGVFAPSSSVNPVAKVGNLGLAAASFSVTCVIDTNGTQIYSDVQNVVSLASLDTLQVTFLQWDMPLVQATFNVTMYVTYGSDTNPVNDTLASQVWTFEETTGINSPYTTNIPTFDGAIDPLTEWSDAVKIDISDVYNMGATGMFPPGSCYLYVKNDAANIYFAVDNLVDATSATQYDQMAVYLDDNNNDVWETSPDTTEGNITIGDFGGVGIYTRWITSGPAYGGWTTRAGLFPVGYGTSSGHQQYEASVPMGSQTDPGAVNTMPGMTVGLYAMCTDDDAATQPGYWPQSNPLWNDPSGYGTLTLGTSGAEDVAVAAIRAPSGTYTPGSSANPVAKVANFGPTPASFDVTCQIDTNGVAIYTDVQNVVNLASLDTLLVAFTQWDLPALPATFNVTMYTVYGADTNPGNDTLTGTCQSSYRFWETWTPYTEGWAGSAETGYDKKLYMFGGKNQAAVSPSNQIAIYDQNSTNWSISSAVLSAINYYGYAVPARGKIFMTGGSSAWATPLANVDCYSPDGDSLNPRTAMPVATMEHVACAWRDSLIYVIGGGNWTMAPIADVQIYDVVNDTWTAGTPLPVATGTHAGAILGDTIVISCGYAGATQVATTHIGVIDPANPANITWSTGDDYPAGALYRVMGGYVSDANNHELMVTGGQAGPVATTYSYSIANGWTQWFNKTTACANVRGGGQVGEYFVIAGGYNGSTYIPNTEALHLWWPTGVAGNPPDLTVPGKFSLLPSWPNPSHGRTTISYSLAHRSSVKLSIYSITGQLVKTLVSQDQPAGSFNATWKGDNDKGQKVAPGVYFYNLKTNDRSATKKLVVVR